jgi:hypothetical protein
MKPKQTFFEKCVGKKWKFYGVDGNLFKLGPCIFEAIEDPDDGYRSYLGSVEVRPNKTGGAIFFKRALATVELVETGTSTYDGFSLVDVKDDHIWLRVGTDTSEDYYPSFVFDYLPKPQVVPGSLVVVPETTPTQVVVPEPTLTAKGLARILSEELERDLWGAIDPNLFRDIAEGRQETEAQDMLEVLERVVRRLEEF